MVYNYHKGGEIKNADRSSRMAQVNIRTGNGWNIRCTDLKLRRVRNLKRFD